MGKLQPSTQECCWSVREGQHNPGCDNYEHIAVSPPEFQKVHATITCPKCQHVFNPNKGYGVYAEGASG